MKTINKFLIESCEANPQKLALIDDNSKFTFSELEEKVNKFSSFLNQFQKKSVISLLFENTSEFVISYLGIINSDCVAHLVPTGISQTNLQNQISSAKPKLVLSSNSHFSKIFLHLLATINFGISSIILPMNFLSNSCPIHNGPAECNLLLHTIQFSVISFPITLLSQWKPVSYTHLTLPTNREV